MTSSLPVVEYLNAVTGWGLSADDYFRTGERILSLRKAFTVREGITPGDQKICKRAAGIPPLSRGPLRRITLDMDGLQREFFDTVGWDQKSGGPTSEKQKELGIDKLVSKEKTVAIGSAQQ
jgi:aldehyde:ferredoxin oxidoreductase